MTSKRDASAPRRTLVVAATPRSGSTYLCQLMRRTGRLGVPNEYFNPDVVRELGGSGAATASESRRLAIDAGMTANGVLAIKLFPYHLQKSQSAHIVDWFGMPAWIWLRRRDTLRQAISLLIAKQTKSYDSQQKPHGLPVYSADEIEREMYVIAAWNAWWETCFARLPTEPLLLWYEDIDRDPDSAVRSIGAFTGIELLQGAAAEAVPFVRQSTPLNEEWREAFVRERGGIQRPPRYRLRVDRIGGMHDLLERSQAARTATILLAGRDWRRLARALRRRLTAVIRRATSPGMAGSTIQPEHSATAKPDRASPTPPAP